MIRKKIGAIAAAVAAASVVLLSAGQASATTTTHYWKPTSSYGGNFGSCSKTVNLQPGIYMQYCTRGWLDLYVAEFRNYVIITNTGTTKQYIQVMGSYAHDDHSTGDSYQTDTGGCYTTPIYANNSFTCESSTASWKVSAGSVAETANVWSAVHVAVSGKDYGWWFTPTVSVTGPSAFSTVRITAPSAT